MDAARLYFVLPRLTQEHSATVGPRCPMDVVGRMRCRVALRTCTRAVDTDVGATLAAVSSYRATALACTSAVLRRWGRVLVLPAQSPAALCRVPGRLPSSAAAGGRCEACASAYGGPCDYPPERLTAPAAEHWPPLLRAGWLPQCQLAPC